MIHFSALPNESAEAATEVTATAPRGASRVCPVCHHADPLGDSEAAWPRDWVCPSCGRAVVVREGIVLTAPGLADTISGFNPGDFDVIAQAELTHFWFVARRRLLVALAAAYAPGARRFVELGCGSGNVLDVLAKARAWNRIVGTDLHPSGLNWARARVAPYVELIQVDARHLPFRDAFDAVGAFDVIEHIEEDEMVIASVRSALVTGGVFLAAVPQHPSLWSVADAVAHHVRRYRRGELEAKLRAGGFDILFSTSYAVSLLPLMVVSRLLARRTDPIDDVEARAIARKEFFVHPTINRLLTSVLNAEVALTRRGVRWPAGGSRVVVARKR
jgi:SAM-dependent methyltransferase